MRKAITMTMPKGVIPIKKPNGRVYWYFRERDPKTRKTKHYPLPGTPDSPAFWREVQRLTGVARETAHAAGTFGALIAAYRNDTSPEWVRLKPSTRRDYSIYLDRIMKTWGDLMVSDLTGPDLLSLRDSMQATPVAANHMIAILKTLLGWSVARGWRADNPAREIPRFAGSEPNKPWPEELAERVLARAKKSGADDIYRAIFLLRNTGLRQGDALALRPANRKNGGFRLRIQKVSKDHFLPLSQAAMTEIDGWENEPMQPYAMASSGNVFTQQTFGARWNRWLKSHDDIVRSLTEHDCSLHGLRALRCCELRKEGLTHQEIGLTVGMSPAMVERYTRHIDQEAASTAALHRFEGLQSSRLISARSAEVPPKGLQSTHSKTEA